MSLMKTLARVAAGVMLAKGVGGMMQQRQQGQQPKHSTGGGILGDLFGNGSQTQTSAGNQGGLGGMLGRVLGGGNGAGSGQRYGGPNSRGASGGLGGMFDQLTQGSSGQRSGGLGDLFGGLAGGAAAGGLGGMLGDLLGGGQQREALAQRGAQPSNDATFGELFNDAVIRQDEPEIAPTPEQNAVAGLMLKAMIQAAKSDGEIDERERERLLGQMGDLDDAEKQFIRDQLAAPADATALAREVPKGLEQQIYLASLMSIDFDNEREARYLNDLAEAMGVSRADTNAIHEQVGVQKLYS